MYLIIKQTDMKKSLLFIGAVLTILVLSAYSFMNWDEKEMATIEKSEIIEAVSNAETTSEEKKKNTFEGFIYDIGPRFSPVKKELVQNATSIDDFYDKIHLQEIEELKSVSIILVINDKQSHFREVGYTSEFNEAQLELLKSSNYDTNFIVRTDYLEKNKVSGILEHSYSTPHLTIVPEKQATHFMGKETLKSYFKENCEEVLKDVDPEKLLAAKIYFTISENGIINKVYQDRPSGYPEVDKRMLQLIKELPGSWSPAENAEGEKVEQELVVSFGLMGC